ncbi:sulfotransferase [Sandarakinorhabdus sp.]|uniref:tetratricopeptide repeat-containing sulfotransferase family protein n=1 Tax=Sandarakinorhabdus sp. TaxID=1916663 RepID=UPI00286DF8E2|nr:sulfotransferase [Sandarakinorhabdus sp.]
MATQITDAAAWQAIANRSHALGDHDAADDAQRRALAAAATDPELLAAGLALVAGDLPVAERALKARLKRDPFDVPAIRMLAELAARIGRLGDAEKLLRRAVELAPQFHAARHNLAIVLQRQGKAADAMAQVEHLLAIDAEDLDYRILAGAVLVRLGEFDRAVTLYDALVAQVPGQPKLWMSLGHVLKTVGRQDDAVAAYRHAIGLAPQLGEVWWSLANLKTVRFGADDMAAMRSALARSDLSEDDRFHLDFALGKALEDARDYPASFAHYLAANDRRRAGLPYDAGDTSAGMARQAALYTREFYAARAGWGCDAPDPIFVVGLPRSGSTLIEQILSSHSQVEGTSELPDLMALARSLGVGEPYAETVRGLDASGARRLGEAYLDSTRVQRKTSRALFIDKMPNNFLQTGLVHLILPNARIIDARRHPMGCCFSAWKQHFARGQAFSYGLADVGRYWADYARLMAHFDAVLPGRVHRVIYERMVASPDDEIRRLLAYCGLEFEASCLNFHENDRAVRTASSQQVRQPMYASAVDHWQHYDKWLTPMRAALGSLLDSYPDV